MMSFPRTILSRRARKKKSSCNSDLDGTTNHTERTQQLFEEEDDENDSNDDGSAAPHLDFDEFESPEEENYHKEISAKELCTNAVPSGRKVSRNNVLQSFFNPKKIFLRCTSNSHQYEKPPLGTRKRVRFAASSSTREVETRAEEIKARWYDDKDCEAMKRDVLMTLEDIIVSAQANKAFAETEYQTAWGLRSTTKGAILERKLYKIASRYIVFDEQEDQRISQKRNPEQIRKVYQEATSRSLEIALVAGRKSECEVKAMNACCSLEVLMKELELECGRI
jgi:hypothetical protein